MLNIEPIKARLAATTVRPWLLTFENFRGCTELPITEADTDMLRSASIDLAALVDEVQRLRDAIKAHRDDHLAGDSEWAVDAPARDRDLWAALND